MEQKHISCDSERDQLPPLSANYPWLVAQKLEVEDGTGDQIFYTIHDQLCHYQCRIPELLERRIRGYFHGWVILSKNNMWYLWNPVTSKIIHLPPLILRDEDADFIGQCCLSSPPDDPSSILLLTRTTRPTFVYCRLNRKLRWTEMLYASQLKKITGYDGLLHCPTFYDGKVYALKTGPGVSLVIQVNIVVKDKEVLIKLLLFGRCPFNSYNTCPQFVSFLKGSRTGLFYIRVAFNELTKETLGNVFLYKLVMSRMRWEEMKEEDLRKFKTNDLIWEEMVDLKDAIFFVDLARESVFYSHAIASELGGYIHIRCEEGKMLYSYDVEDETISVSSMPYPTSHVSLWECWLGGDNGEAKCTLDSEPEKDKEAKIVAPDDEVELIESRLLNIPFHILEMVMELCVGVEYMYFRATCKRCHLAAPLIQWSDQATLRRLHQYCIVANGGRQEAGHPYFYRSDIW